MKLKSLTDVITKEKYYLVPDTGLQLRRTAGALVWPCSGVPGAVIVLGETRSRPSFLGQRRHDVHRLAEYTSTDETLLIDKVMLWTSDYYIRSWATPMCDHRQYLLEDANDELRAFRKHRIRYSDPHGWVGKGEGLIESYNGLVRRRTMGEKTLHLGQQCAAVAELQSIPETKINAKPTDFPAAAALWFALAEIDLNPMSEWDERKDKDRRPADAIGGY